MVNSGQAGADQLARVLAEGLEVLVVLALHLRQRGSLQLVRHPGLEAVGDLSPRLGQGCCVESSPSI